MHTEQGVHLQCSGELGIMHISQHERLLWAGRLTERRSRGPRTDRRCPTLHEANTMPVGNSHGVMFTAMVPWHPRVSPGISAAKYCTHHAGKTLNDSMLDVCSC